MLAARFLATNFLTHKSFDSQKIVTNKVPTRRAYLEYESLVIPRELLVITEANAPSRTMAQGRCDIG